MRRLFAAAMGAIATAAALTSPALAATTTTRVDGSHFGAASLRPVRQDCSDPGNPAPRGTPVLIKLDKKQAPLGARFVGWRPTEGGFGYGAAAHVTEPTTFNDVRFRLFWPQQQASGQIVAFYPDAAGEWRGRSTLPIDRTFGWHSVDVPDPVFEWFHYSEGTLDNSAPSATLADFASDHGGDSQGADIGFAFGCDGNRFFVDALSVRSASGRSLFNFEGFRTHSSLARGTKVPSKVTIDYGEHVGITAKLRKAFGDKAMAGKVRLDSRALSSKKWSNHDGFKVAKSGKDLRLGKPKGWAYRLRYAGNAKYEASKSKVLKILVRSKVRAGLVDDSVTKGKTFTTTGRVLPGRATRVVLQRYVNHKWTNVKSGRSGKTGKFRISMTAKSVGTSYWRAKVGSGGGNIGNKSKAMKLTVKYPPTTGGGGGGGGDTPPPPPPPDDPPPPPPTH